MERYKNHTSAAAVNHAISALASVLNVSMGEGFMQSSCILYFRKSANTWKPTGPALSEIWNVALIFNWLRKGSSLHVCFGADLMGRAVILLRIDLFARASDLTKMFREQIVWGKDELKVRFLRPKEWRPGGKRTQKQWSEWVTVGCVAEPNICSFHVLRKWLQVSEKDAPLVRADGNVMKPLFYKTVKGKSTPLSIKDISSIFKASDGKGRGS